MIQKWCNSNRNPWYSSFNLITYCLESDKALLLTFHSKNTGISGKGMGDGDFEWDDGDGEDWEDVLNDELLQWDFDILKMQLQ